MNVGTRRTVSASGAITYSYCHESGGFLLAHLLTIYGITQSPNLDSNSASRALSAIAQQIDLEISAILCYVNQRH